MCHMHIKTYVMLLHCDAWWHYGFNDGDIIKFPNIFTNLDLVHNYIYEYILYDYQSGRGRNQ